MRSKVSLLFANFIRPESTLPIIVCAHCAIISFTLWYQCSMFIVHNFPFFIVNKTILSFCCRKMAFAGNLTECHVNLSWFKWKEISRKKTRTNWHIVKLSFDILFEGLRELNTIWKGKLMLENWKLETASVKGKKF